MIADFGIRNLIPIAAKQIRACQFDRPCSACREVVKLPDSGQGFVNPDGTLDRLATMWDPDDPEAEDPEDYRWRRDVAIRTSRAGRLRRVAGVDASRAATAGGWPAG
jgi:hypothetical protein